MRFTTTDHLSKEQLERIIDQIIDIIEQLHKPSWNNVSGLAFSLSSQAVVPGCVLEETFWQAPDVARHFPSSESVETLNIKGPYGSYTAYITALIHVYQHSIHQHPSLESFRNLLPVWMPGWAHWGAIQNWTIRAMYWCTRISIWPISCTTNPRDALPPSLTGNSPVLSLSRGAIRRGHFYGMVSAIPAL